MKLDRICKARMWSKLAQPRAADLPEPKVRPRFFLRGFGDFRCQLLIIRRRRAIAELCLLHPPKADIGTAGIYEYTALVEQDRHKSTAPLPAPGEETGITRAMESWDRPRTRCTADATSFHRWPRWAGSASPYSELAAAMSGSQSGFSTRPCRGQ
jgi:hypothetical protein